MYLPWLLFHNIVTYIRRISIGQSFPDEDKETNDVESSRGGRAFSVLGSHLMYRAICRQQFMLAGRSLPTGAIVDVIKVDAHHASAIVRDPYDGSQGVTSLDNLSRIGFYDALEKYPFGERPASERDKGKVFAHEPVLGFILFEHVGSDLDELTVLPYDVVEIVRNVDQLWVWAKLYVSGEHRILEGRVPRRLVAIQQINQKECNFN